MPRVRPQKSSSGNKVDTEGNNNVQFFATHMVVLFILVSKIWINNKRYYVIQEIVQGNLKEPIYSQKKLITKEINATPYLFIHKHW